VAARTLDVAGFLGALGEARLAGDVAVLVALGGWGVEGHERVGLIALEDKPRVLEDAYLPSSACDGLVWDIARARPKARARKGGWNTMHATGWSFAWSDDAGSLVVVDCDGRVAWREGELLHLREGGPVERMEIAAVEPYVSEDWVRRGVRLRLRDGAVREMVYEDDQSPLIVPFYDGLNLMAETSWTHDLARAVSHGLGPPIVDCTG
jgi:hypothetical protein